MASHIHLILGGNGDMLLTDIIRDLKNYTSLSFRKLLENYVFGNWSSAAAYAGERKDFIDLLLKNNEHTKAWRFNDEKSQARRCANGFTLGGTTPVDTKVKIFEIYFFLIKFKFPHKNFLSRQPMMDFQDR